MHKRVVLYRNGVDGQLRAHELEYVWQRSGLVLVRYTGPSYHDAHALGVTPERHRAEALMQEHQTRFQAELGV